MHVGAMFCKNCKEIIISRSQHDLVMCSCGKCFLDGGHLTDDGNFLPRRGSYNDYGIEIYLRGDVFLGFILNMDARGNSNAGHFENGYWERFKIVESSNMKFYKKLIINYEDFIRTLNS